MAARFRHSAWPIVALSCLFLTIGAAVRAQPAPEREAEQDSEQNLRFACSLLKSLLGDHGLADVEIETMHDSLKRRDPNLAAEVHAYEERFQKDRQRLPLGDAEQRNYPLLVEALQQELKEVKEQLAASRMENDRLGVAVGIRRIVSPGRILHFALAGFLDMDNDGKDDAAMFEKLIHVNGGVIDATINQRGEITGKLTPSTDYLLLGKPPAEDADPKVVAAYAEFIAAAEKMGLKVLEISSLAQMSSNVQGQTPPGKNAAPKFRPRRPSGY